MYRLTLSAVPYFWSKQAYFEFYHAVAESSVSSVYLGETVCSKRRSMNLQDWLAVAEMLANQGKQVVMSTMTLLEAESELKNLSNIIRNSNFDIEANDISAIQLAYENQREFIAGSAINIYNIRTLEKFHRLGLKRWVVPVELGSDDLKPLLAKAKEQNIEVEYQVFGRMPLAFSARCFTARHHQLPKDACELSCGIYEDGIAVKTQEGDLFAQINGIQTQSAKVSFLLPYLADMQSQGITHFRITPVRAQDTLNLLGSLTQIQNSQETLQGLLPQQCALIRHELESSGYQLCNGYWLQMEGMQWAS